MTIINPNPWINIGQASIQQATLCSFVLQAIVLSYLDPAHPLKDNIHHLRHINCLPSYKILEWPNWKHFADDNINVT